MAAERTALIAGGGIAGLAAATALARAGWAVRVFERAPVIAEVGAGLQMSPNATKVLRWLGVLDAVEAAAVAPEAAEMRDGRTGAVVFRAALGERARHRWGAPYLHIHRADLHRILLDAAEAAGAALETGLAVTDYAMRSEGVRATIEPAEGADRSDPASSRVETAALLIGADGIRSAMRRGLNGPEEPRFTGQIAWRATIPVERLPEGLVPPKATVWTGPGRHVVTYLLRRGALANLVAVEEADDWREEGWSAKGDPALLRARFAGWHSDVTRLLDAVEETFRWALFTRPEQVRWVDGRLALIGDAAHPMLPFLAQGAAMALEDVAVLTGALASRPATARGIEAALMAYETARWGRVTRVQARSAANGRLYHRRSGVGRAAVRAPMAVAGVLAPGLLTRQLDWLYGHDPLAPAV